MSYVIQPNPWKGIVTVGPFIDALQTGLAAALTTSLTVNGTANRISVSTVGSTATVDIAATYVGQASITTLGTIGTGIWQGSVINSSFIDAALARLASPTFTGTPAGPTAAVDTNTTQLATTAYVIGQGYLKAASASGLYQPLDATLTALAAYNTNGLLTQTAADTFTGRTLTGTTSRIAISNGNGVSGNPTVDIDAAYVGQSSITTLGTIGTGVWQGSTISGSFLDLSSRQPLDSTLTSLAAFNTNGLLTQTAADTFTGRTLTGTASRISITNGSGVSGNPTVDIDATYVGQSSITTLGTIGTGTWQGSVISASFIDAAIARLASPTLTGDPKAPTPTAGDNDTSIATTAFVTAALAAFSTVPSGTVAPFAGTTAPSGWNMADGTTLNRTTQATLFSAITFTLTGTLTSASAVVTGLSSTDYIGVGCKVEGTNIPANATVLSIDSATQVTLSANATGSGSTSIRFLPHGNGDGSTTFNVPDMRGRTLGGVAPKSASGHADMWGIGSSDGTAIGSRRLKHSHGLGTIAIGASGSHTHTFTGSAVTSGNNSVDHTHSGTTGTVSADHSHIDSGHFTPFTDDSGSFTGNASAFSTTGPHSGDGFDGSTYQNRQQGTQHAVLGGITVNHTHAFTTGGVSVNHTHSVTASGSNSSTTHSHVNGDFSGSVGTTASAPAESAAYLTMNFIIKL